MSVRRVTLPAVLAALAVLAVVGAPSVLAKSKHHHKKRPDPVLAALKGLDGGAPAAELDADRATYASAVQEVRRLGGVQRRELRSVVIIVRGMAQRGALTPQRLKIVFLTLQRNLEWWSQHGPPVAGSPGEKDARGRRCKPLRMPKAHASRLSFPGSAVIWQYYPGLGLQLQVNGTFAAANGLLASKAPEAGRQAAAILDEMRTLTVDRGGAVTWEYLFPFGGGLPPWASGLSQATAIRAYLNAADKLHRSSYLRFARRLAALFALRPPTGVNDRLKKDGSWYALYTFAPATHVLNAQLDAVIALHDLAQATGDGRAAALEREGLRAVRRRISSFDLHVWSRYQEGGPPADLNYHVLNRDLARGLCERTGQPAICRAWHSFTAELQARCPRPTPTPSPPSPSEPALSSPAPSDTAPAPTPAPTTGGAGAP